MREFLGVLYVVGAIVTTAGVVLAYRRARRDLRRLEDLAELHESHDAPDVVETYIDAATGAEERRIQREAVRSSQEAELANALKEAGIRDGMPRYKDMRLPMEYWAKRSALRDAVASFRSGGLVALAGLAISTVASVWSLYL